MEDFIYILIGIAWIAYSVYSQGQKKKRKQEQQKSAFKTEEDLPEVKESISSMIQKELNLDKIFDFDEQPADEYLDNPYSEIDVVEEKDESAYFKAENEGVSAFAKKPETEKDKEASSEIESSEYEVKENDLTMNNSVAEEFDLKKAVIFSEILNPPYINK